MIVTATPRFYNQLCSFDNFLQLTANVWTLLRLTDMWGKKLFSIFFICLWTFNDLSWIYMDQLKTAEIGTSVMRQDTYQVLTSYINNEKRNCQKIVLRKPFFFTTMFSTIVLNVFRLNVNSLRDIRDPLHGTLGRSSAGCWDNLTFVLIIKIPSLSK